MRTKPRSRRFGAGSHIKRDNPRFRRSEAVGRLGLEPRTRGLKDQARRRTLPSTCDFSPSRSPTPCLCQHRSTSFRVTFDVTVSATRRSRGFRKQRIPNPLTMRVRDPGPAERGNAGGLEARRVRAGPRRRAPPRRPGSRGGHRPTEWVRSPRPAPRPALSPAVAAVRRNMEDHCFGTFPRLDRTV